MKRIKQCLSVILVVCLMLFIASVVATGMAILQIQSDSSDAHATINNQFQYSTKFNFYFESKDMEEHAIETLTSSFDKLPKHIENIIKNDWVIVVATNEPFTCNDNLDAAGITYSGKHVIWLCPSFSENVFLHECGHAIDYYLGDVSNRNSFQNIFYNNWETYREYNQDKINKHSTSSDSEFFASLFADYIIAPEYVRDNCPDAYNYFNNLLENDISFSAYGDFINKLMETPYLFINLFKQCLSELKSSNYYSEVNTVNENIKNNDQLNIDNYNESYNISWMEEDTRIIAETIIDLSKNPDKYPNEKHGFSKGYAIEFDYPWSIDMYTEILSFTSAYFGNESLDPIDVNVINGTRTEVVIKHDIVAIGEANRQASLKKVDNVLSTFKTGTQTEIAIQVSQYIIENSTYKLEKHSSFNSFWENKSGDCVMYAIIFKQFMDRLGIQNDIVHVVASNGDGHVYNRIYTNGTYKYYDLSSKLLNVSCIDKVYHLNTWQVQ